MNSGRAVSVQLDDEVQMVVIMASPAGREVNSTMPTQATPSRASPTQTPVPSKRNRVKRKIPVSANSSMAGYSVWRSAADSSPRAGRPPKRMRRKWSASASARTEVPTAIDSCGIQIGEASCPWEMSFSL